MKKLFHKNKMYLKSILILTSLFFWILNISPSWSVLNSSIFSYDDAQNAKGLHVFLKGESWHVRNAQKIDHSFYEQLLLDYSEYYDLSERLSINEELAGSLRNFAGGRPDGMLTAKDKDVHPFMLIWAADTGPGVAKVSCLRTFNDEGRYSSLGKEVAQAFVEQWAPEVRRIGLGEGLDETQDENIIKAFKCFGGRELQALEALVVPWDTGALKTLDDFGFTAQQGDPLKIHVNFKSNEAGYRALAETLRGLYYLDEEALSPGKRYVFTDMMDIKRAFSRDEEKNTIIFHFEKSLVEQD